MGFVPNWSRASVVGLSALKDFETGTRRRTLPAIRAQLQRAFEEVGVEFPSEDSIRVKTVIENQRELSMANPMLP